MPGGGAQYQIGNVGEGANVQQGEYLINVSVQVQNSEDADELLRRIRKELGQRAYHGPPLRRLDPLVLVNRAEQLVEVSRFLEQSDASMLYVLGLPGIGKSALVRGALEFQRAEAAAVWVNCEGLDAEQLLAEVDAGLRLEVRATLDDSSLGLTRKIAAVLAAINQPGILILDGFEALLDAKDQYKSKDIARVIEDLVALEHKAKVLATTSRLPQAIGRGTAGVEILRLGGLSKAMAKNLFQRRARIAPEEIEATLPKEAFERLEGHPKFIELLASAISELDVNQVVKDMLSASDIGEYVVSQVLNQLSDEEMQALRAALVFRGAFSFEALGYVYSKLNNEAELIATPVRTLVRRTVLETVAEPQTAYYLHGILRDAAPRKQEQEASAHSAAAEWFLRREFNAANVETWDDGLYHLRRAAEIGSDETYERYYSFVFDKQEPLYRAGFGRRLIDELRTLYALAEDTFTKLGVRWKLGIELARFNKRDESLTIFREVAHGLSEALDNLPDDLQEAAMSAEEYREAIADWLTLVKLELASVLMDKAIFVEESLANRDWILEAQQIADDVQPRVEASKDSTPKEKYLDLRFSLARRAGDSDEMLNWATQTYQLAEELSERAAAGTEEEWFALSHLAQAHFQLAISYMNTRQLADMMSHFTHYLSINIRLGNLTAVGAGLYNCGVFLSVVEPLSAGALLVTCEQLEFEIGSGGEDRATDITEPMIEQLLSDENNVNEGRDRIIRLSEKLLPYYDRAIERRRL